MVRNYLSTKPGFLLSRQYQERFDCSIGVEEPGDILVLDLGDEVLMIPNNETVDDFRQTIQQSLTSGKNLLAERYAANKSEQIEGVVY